jgi:hypothetical protein
VVANVVVIFDDVLVRMKCQMISTGLSSGDFDGNGMSVMLPGTGSLIEEEKSVSIRSDRFDRLILVASSVGLGEVIRDGLRITDRRVVDLNNFRDLGLPGFSFSLTPANWTRATFLGIIP